MDLASLLGLVIALILCIFGITFKDGGFDFSVITSFLDVPSALITFGGAFAATLVMNSFKTFTGGLKSFTMIFKASQLNPAEIIQKIIDLSNVARKEGLLSLEEAASDINDDFLKKGIMLIVDGTDPELVHAIMETELDCIGARHKEKIKFWQDLGAMGPAWGMIGTLIGLVNMLNNMEDASSIGPAMAVALLTTMYGSLLSNWICTPTSSKLAFYDGQEQTVKTIMIEGLLSIQAGENPRVIEEKLKSFLAPSERPAGEAAEGGEQ